MAQVFTYFKPDGTSEVRTQANGPLPQKGEVWVRGRYEGLDLPNPLDVRVGTAGIKVWMVIQWFQLGNGDRERLLADYGGVLSAADVNDAIWFYGQNRDAIDQRIEHERQPA